MAGERLRSAPWLSADPTAAIGVGVSMGKLTRARGGACCPRRRRRSNSRRAASLLTDLDTVDSPDFLLPRLLPVSSAGNLVGAVKAAKSRAYQDLRGGLSTKTLQTRRRSHRSDPQRLVQAGKLRRYLSWGGKFAGR